MVAFFDLDIAVEGVPRRTVVGQKGIAFPVTGLPEVKVLHEGCRTCKKAAEHAPCVAIGVSIPFGESRFDRIPEAQRFSIAKANRIQGGLFLLQNMAQGYVLDGTPYNAGFGADNGSQGEIYTVVAAAGKRLTLKGRNPKKIAQARSYVNNNPYPIGADDQFRPPGMSDEDWEGTPDAVPPYSNGYKYARLIQQPFFHCLPVGSQVEFNGWSVLSGKNWPIITKVYPPDSEELVDVEFDVDVSNDVSAALEPWDLTYAPPDASYYKCKVRFEATRPARWLNWQAPIETQFSPHQKTVVTEATHPLLDQAGNATRVLWPDMGSGLFRCRVVGTSGAVTELSVEECKERLVTTDTGSGWETTFSTIGLGIGTTALRAIVDYHAESTAGDVIRIPFAGSCANSQVDPSGSYTHDGDRRCTSVDSSGFESYRRVCWKPGSCDGFALGDEKVAYGAGMPMPVHDFPGADFWGSLYHREDWLLKQTLAGFNHFTIDRPPGSGPSVESLGGGWAGGVPSAKAERVVPLWGPQFGRLLQLTDEDGNEFLRLLQGAFFARAGDFTAQGGADYTYIAASAPTAGFIPAAVSGYGTKAWPNGTNKTNGYNYFPWKGTGRCNVGADWGYAASGLADGNRRYADAEVYVTGMASVVEDGDLTEAIRDRFGG